MEFDADDMPFLRLPAPNTNIIITHPLYSDGEVVTELLNDPRLYNNLLGPPFPYTRKDWDESWPRTEQQTREALAELRDVERARKVAGDGDVKRWMVGRELELTPSQYSGNPSPVSSIREVDPVSGEQRFLGVIGIFKRGSLNWLNEMDNTKFMEEHEALPGLKTPWGIGYYLTPNVHSRGIMTGALYTLIHGFMIPYMDIRLITGTYCEHNTASKRVFEKNGFEAWKTATQELSESKTGMKGKKVGLCVMRWIRKA